MNKMQTKLLELVGEIDRECERLSLPYTLFGKTAGRACRDGCFYKDDLAFELMMYAHDIPVLKRALESGEYADRAVEDLHSNPALASAALRYVDTSTTLLQREDPVRYQHLGVAVTIHPLYTAAPSRSVKAAASMVSHCNGGVDFNFATLAENQKKLVKWGENATVLGLAARRFHASLRKDPDDRSMKKRYYYIDGELRSTNRALLDKTARVPFEGLELSVYKATNKYLELLYGRKASDWLNEVDLPSSAFSTISDADCPYVESLAYLQEEGVDLRKVQETLHRNHLWRCKVYQPSQLKKSNTYRYALLARDRIDYYVKTEPLLPELRAAMQEDDVEKLKVFLGRYFHFTRKYIRRGKGFFATQELFEMAKKVWFAKDGNNDYADKVYSCIPKAHLERDIKEYIDQYR